ncbi:MAG: hypothetical protein IPK87_13135 [Planctomycetes bacterium]|nr:hypothetical protein [Planctomycetota bacterium]
MPRIVLAMLVATLAAAAGLGGTYLRDWIDPKSVHAQEARSDKGIRVALVNLEAVSRESEKFRQLKDKWNGVQRELGMDRDEAEQRYRSKAMDVQRARKENRDQEEVGALEIELRTLKDALEMMKKQHAEYLESLLAHYQQEVLSFVMAVVKEYADYHEYDLVLQDYTLDDSGKDFFAGAAYAQTLINKPVLYAPNGATKGARHVTDISADVLKWSSGERPAPKKD